MISTVLFSSLKKNKFCLRIIPILMPEMPMKMKKILARPKTYVKKVKTENLKDA